MRRFVLLALLALAAGCAAAPSREASAPRSDRVVTPSATSRTAADSTDRFGYRAERGRLLERIDRARDPEEQARLVLELADLAERTRAAAIAEGAALEKSLAYSARDEREALATLARRALDDEVQQLERIARDFETYHRRDEALYRLGWALLDWGSADAALHHFRTLFDAYPESPYVPHAYLAFADRDFEEKDLAQAAKLYEKVIAFGNAEASPRAHLQLGRCRLAAGASEDALASFVDAANAAQGAPGPGAATVRDEALSELVKAYAASGDPSAALALFERAGPERVDELLERLGKAYFDDGRFRESIAVNRQVADRVECAPSMARASVAVFEARLYLGEVVELKAEGDALVEVFARLTKCLPPERLGEFAEAGAMAKEAIENQAARYRREYEFSGEPAAAEMAVQLDAMAESF